MRETLIYGLEQGQTESYMETLLCTNATTEEQIQKVIDYAKEHGFHSFRIAYYDGSKPDFTKVLNI